MEVFKAIGWECGSLEEIHSRTLSLEQCFSARIKVGGKASGFIPAEINLRLGSETCTVKLKVLTNLNCSQKNCYRFPTYIGDFNRCSVVVVAKNCGDEGETPKICTGNNSRDKFTRENGEDECVANLSENLKRVDENPMTVENHAKSLDVEVSGFKTNVNDNTIVKLSDVFWRLKNSLGRLEGAVTGSKKFGLKCSPNEPNNSGKQGVGLGIDKKRAKLFFKNALKVKGLKISKWSSNNGLGVASFKRKFKKSNLSVDEGDKEIYFDLNGDESSNNNFPKQYVHPMEILHAELEENENEDAAEFDRVGDWGGELVSRLDEQEDLSSEDSGLGEEENNMMQIIEMDDTCLPLLFHIDEVGETLRQGNPEPKKLFKHRTEVNSFPFPLNFRRKVLSPSPSFDLNFAYHISFLLFFLYSHLPLFDSVSIRNVLIFSSGVKSRGLCYNRCQKSVTKINSPINMHCLKPQELNSDLNVASTKMSYESVKYPMLDSRLLLSENNINSDTEHRSVSLIQKPLTNEASNLNRMVGLSKKDWEPLNRILENMEVNLVPCRGNNGPKRN
ncbi:hypothetical protein LguiA_029563 [Lonicera macranthoides]